MFSQKPIITDAGITLLIRAAGGEKVTFTKFQAGSGVLASGETPKGMTAMKNPVLTSIPITQATGTEEDGYVKLSGKFDNQTDVQASFRWTELGLIAEDENGVEYLYAYGYDNANAEIIAPSGGTVIIEQNFSVIIAIGESENITVNVLPSASYASQAALDAHTGNTSNPHNVTLEQVGAAAASHTHDASDVGSGILAVERGGTGVNTLTALALLISSQMPNQKYVIGHYSGNGGVRQDINLGFEPELVMIFKGHRMEVSGINHEMTNNGIAVFSPAQNFVAGGHSEDMIISADALFAKGFGGAAVTASGFAVGYSANGCHLVNDYEFYIYLAFRTL